MARKKDDLAKGFAGALPKAPKRSAVPEKEARRFERAPASVAAQPGSKLRRDERGERVSAYVPAEIAEEVRVRCARERRSVSDAVTRALEMWLSSTTKP